MMTNANICTDLSRTPMLVGQVPGRGNYMVVLSYWKSLDHLRDFAAKSYHANGRRWWDRTKKQWPYIGIFHETYNVPTGHYEAIYENFHPFGIGQIGLGKGEEGKRETVESGQEEALVRADGRKWRSMDSRMGREEKVLTSV